MLTLIYANTTLGIAITSFLLGLFVLTKGSRNRVYVSWFLFCLFISGWNLGYYFTMFPHIDKMTALLSSRLSHASGALIPAFFVNFIYSWLYPEYNKNKKIVLLVSFISCSIIAFLSLTSLVVIDLTPKLFMKFYPVGKIGYLIYVINFAWWIIFVHSVMISEYRNLTIQRKNQLRYFFLGTSVGFLGGMTCFPLIFGFPFPPYASNLIFLSPLIITIAILRHQLMDIEVFIKKSLIFAGTFIFAFGVFVGITLLISQLIGGGRIISLAISSIIIIIGMHPIETWLVNVTDKFLFQKKYEYKQILKKFIDDVITVLNLDEVVNSTLKLLDESLHPYAASIFILNRADDKYNLYGSYGLENKDIAFTSESKLVYFLKKTHNPAVIKQVEGIKGVDPLIALEIHSLKAVLVLPFLLHDDLIGFIALGRKRSDEDYTKDDLDILLDLARTESIAIGNAQLLTEAAQAERRAAIGTMAAGINHEIGNPLNIMSTKIQLFKMARQKGLLRDKPVEEALDQAEAALDECLKQSVRISGVTKKLSNFAKPSKEFKPQLLNLSEEIDETLSVVGYDIDIGKVQINKNFTSGSFRVLADKQEIQQVFFNILRNAAQAIDGTGTITVSILNTGSEKVRVEIQDTGKGIPEDKVHRVFEPFFTTKGASKGTGLGLSIVRQLVWRNKGEISFKSQAGVGTTFIVEFPKGE